MAETYAMKRIELIVERMAARRAGRVLQESGVTGYTVLPALEGYGNGQTWRRDADISGSSDMVAIVCVTSAEAASAALDNLAQLLAEQIGIVTVNDVQVLRPERF
ncbi:MAG: DUF190 domain-containing protein [Pseudomonadota bacterium]